MARTDAATREHLRRSAQRAAKDPKQLARAERIIQAAVADEHITIDDHVHELAAVAPPLTPGQRDRLAALFTPTPSAGRVA